MANTSDSSTWSRSKDFANVVGRTSPSDLSDCHSMRYTPTLQDLHLGRPHIRASCFTPRKCMVGFVLLLILTVLVVRFLWTLSHAFSDLHLSSDNDGELVIVPDDIAGPAGAYCLDGSLPGFYFRKGKSRASKKWLLALPHAGWCWTVSDCYNRTGSPLVGSTRDIATTHQFTGILSSNPSVNPRFATWNMVLVVPCDGSAFLGNNSNVLTQHGKDMHLRGSAVLTVVVDYLSSTRSLSDALQVVLYGQASSAIAALLHADYVQAQLKVSSGVAVIADGGILLSYSDDVRSDRFKHFAAVHGLQDSVRLRGCTRQTEAVDACLSVDRLLSFVGCPAILLSSLFDSWSAYALHEVDCTRSPSCFGATSSEYARQLVRFARSLSLDSRAAYLTVCTSSLLCSDELYIRSHPLAFDVSSWLNDVARGSLVIEEDDVDAANEKFARCL